MPLTTMNVPPDMQDSAELEVSLASALELSWLGLGTLVDVRQSMEIELKGAIPASVHIPLFEKPIKGSQPLCGAAAAPGGLPQGVGGDRRFPGLAAFPGHDRALSANRVW